MSTQDRDTMSRRMFLDGTAKAGAMAFAAGVIPLAPGKAGADEPGKWLNGVYRQLHIDTHFGGFKTIYRDFDAEACAQAFADAGVQMVSYFAKCWAGYSYYPTKIGTIHPGLDRDFTGELTAALRKRGIRRIVYFMLGMERRYQKEHPGWIRNTDSAQQIFAPEAIADAAMMCFNSPYVDEYGIPQMKEIMSLYDIDGFFVDIVMQQFLQSNCYCGNCRESYEREVGGPMPLDDADPNAFRYRRWANRHMEAHMEKVHRELSAVDPDITIINNYSWMFRYPVTPPRYVHHITWDTPVPKVGNFAWNFSLEARYVSTLPGVTWSCMNTRGNTWGEYSLREPEAFLSECATLLAACGRTYLSDIPYPHGNPDRAVMKVFGEVNRRTRELEPYLRDCRPVPDVAVLHAADSVWSKAPMKPTPSWAAPPAYYSVCGAHKALIEGHCQMAILNSDRLPEAIDGYGALVLPDQRILGGAECAAIRSFVSNGGALIVTGGTGIRDTDNRALTNFALSDVLGVDYLGSSGTANCYLRMERELPEYGIPAMDIQVTSDFARVKTTTADTVLEIVPPFEGIRNGTPPPALNTAGPGVTANKYGRGTAIYCAAKLFDSYFRESTPVLRKLAMWLLDTVYPPSSRKIVVENTPANIELFHNSRDGERFVHLVNYAGDKREFGIPQTQDFVTAHGIVVHMRLAKKPSEVAIIPDGIPMDFTFEGGWLRFEARPLAIHDVYRVRV